MSEISVRRVACTSVFHGETYQHYENVPWIVACLARLS